MINMILSSFALIGSCIAGLAGAFGVAFGGTPHAYLICFAAIVVSIIAGARINSRYYPSYDEAALRVFK